MNQVRSEFESGEIETMETRFQQEMRQLKMTILQMAALSETALKKALQALFERNIPLADDVVARDQEINLLEVAVDRHCLRLLALEQPMARDLRFIIGCMRIAVDLERVADQAVNVAQRAQFLGARPPLPPNRPVSSPRSSTKMSARPRMYARWTTTRTS